MKKLVNYGIGGYCKNCRETHDHPLHNIVEVIDISDEPQRPLEPMGVMAALLVVSGSLDIDDAANAVGLHPDDLIAEAQAWAVAVELNNGSN